MLGSNCTDEVILIHKQLSVLVLLGMAKEIGPGLVRQLRLLCAAHQCFPHGFLDASHCATNKIARDEKDKIHNQNRQFHRTDENSRRLGGRGGEKIGSEVGRKRAVGVRSDDLADTIITRVVAVSVGIVIEQQEKNKEGVFSFSCFAFFL